MHKLIKLNTIVIFLILSFAAYSQTDPDAQNDRFRAMWVYNISNNVDWPNDDTIRTYVVGVYSNSDGVYNELVTLSKSQKIKDKPVKIVKFTRFKKITKTHILYVGYDNNSDIYRVNSILDNTPTLLITDRIDDVDNFMVNILPFDQGAKRIEIDKTNIEAHLLGVTDQLLYHGGSEQELKDLYSQQKKELDAQITLLQQKKAEIETLQNDFEEQKELLGEQQILLQTQKQQLQQMTATLEQQKLALQKNESMILEQEMLIKQKQTEVQQQIKEMNDKEEILNQKNDEILAKQYELQELEDQIASSKSALSNANQTIENQKETLKIVAIFLFVIFIFSIFLGAALRKNSRMNKELTKKNKEISDKNLRIEHQALLLENTNKELEKLSIVAENAQNGVVIMDKLGNIEWVNAGFTKMYGYTLQLFINERDINIIKSSSSPEIQKVYQRCLEEKTPVTYEMKSTTRNGENMYVKTTLTPILNEKDEIDKLVAIDTDISEIKKANDEITKQHQQITAQANELKNSNKELEKLSIVVSETNNAVMITDGHGNIEWVNPAFTKTFGYTLDEFTSKVSKNIIADTSKKNVKESITKLYETKQPVSYQLLTHNKEGNEIWIQANLTPIINENNEVEKIIVVDSDITFIKEAEKEIIEKNYELTTQKEQIEEQNNKIEASIKYAQTIQQSILPLKTVTEQFFNSEIIFKPKDIVSGDFYWFFGLKESHCWYAASVDCTGHGVPGAFMSLISSRILNEILIQNPNIEPSDILEQADTKIRSALMQDKTNNNDGLDIALAKVINTDNQLIVHFAGAKRNLFIYQNNVNTVKSLPGTRRSIGGIKRTRTKTNFVTSKAEIEKGDILYLMTDGYIDQNDKFRKRYGSVKTEESILKIGNLSLVEQKNILLKELNNHMQGTEQRDDITLWIIKT
ncbi:MAG: DUF4154 domain-containing protein [Bacteroidales bacterium]|nr:DUF4154 domain-containing protein [Bacteroidales bacterium]